MLTDAEEQGGHQPHERGGEDESQGDADHRGLQPFDDDEAQDAGRRCAERQANANLTHALADGVGEHAVDADAREDEREHCERGEQLHRHRALPQRLIDDALHRLDVEHGLFRIDGADRGDDRSRERVGRDGGPDDQRRSVEGVLRGRCVDGGL